MSSSNDHAVPLWGLFLALTGLTAVEVTLFESWYRFEVVNDAIPKYLLVILILLFTLPKAMIVLVYFMHLKFEKQAVIGLAIAPFLFALLAVLPTLSDTLTLKQDAHNQVEVIGEYGGGHGHGHGEAHEEAEASEPESEAGDSMDPYGY